MPIPLCGIGNVRGGMKKIIILTGSELRHDFMRKFVALADDIEVIASYCERSKQSVYDVFEKDMENDLRKKHMLARERSEKDFFELFARSTPDRSNPIVIEEKEINDTARVQEVIEARPDLIIAYGCSLIKPPLVDAFQGRFLNVHLGLSPYYRGAATNYWPLVNGEPEYVGATFMYMDNGIDTGEIIHQMRAQVMWGDTPGQIGNRLIMEIASVYQQIVLRFDEIKKVTRVFGEYKERVYRKKDFTEESVQKLYSNFSEGMIGEYIAHREARCANVPIVQNPLFLRK